MNNCKHENTETKRESCKYYIECKDCKIRLKTWHNHQWIERLYDFEYFYGSYPLLIYGCFRCGKIKSK